MLNFYNIIRRCKIQNTVNTKVGEVYLGDLFMLKKVSHVAGGAKVKSNGAVAVAREKNGANSRHFRAIFKPNFV